MSLQLSLKEPSCANQPAWQLPNVLLYPATAKGARLPASDALDATARQFLHDSFELHSEADVQQVAGGSGTVQKSHRMLEEGPENHTSVKPSPKQQHPQQQQQQRQPSKPAAGNVVVLGAGPGENDTDALGALDISGIPDAPSLVCAHSCMPLSQLNWIAMANVDCCGCQRRILCNCLAVSPQMSCI